MDYGYPERRVTKRDLREKARYNKYKRGGKLRTINKNLNKEKV